MAPKSREVEKGTSTRKPRGPGAGFKSWMKGNVEDLRPLDRRTPEEEGGDVAKRGPDNKGKGKGKATADVPRKSERQKPARVVAGPDPSSPTKPSVTKLKPAKRQPAEATNAPPPTPVDTPATPVVRPVVPADGPLARQYYDLVDALCTEVNADAVDDELLALEDFGEEDVEGVFHSVLQSLNNARESLRTIRDQAESAILPESNGSGEVPDTASSVEANKSNDGSGVENDADQSQLKESDHITQSGTSQAWEIDEIDKVAVEFTGVAGQQRLRERDHMTQSGTSQAWELNEEDKTAAKSAGIAGQQKLREQALPDTEADVSTGELPQGVHDQNHSAVFPDNTSPIEQQSETPKVPSSGVLSSTSAAASSSIGGSRPAFPVVGSADFLSAFSQNAKSEQDRAKQARMDEDYDSDDEDEATWEARDLAKQEAKRKTIEDAAKSGPGFAPSDAPLESGVPQEQDVTAAPVPEVVSALLASFGAYAQTLPPVAVGYYPSMAAHSVPVYDNIATVSKQATLFLEGRLKRKSVDNGGDEVPPGKKSRAE